MTPAPIGCAEPAGVSASDVFPVGGTQCAPASAVIPKSSYSACSATMVGTEVVANVALMFVGTTDDVTEEVSDATAFLVGRGYADASSTNYAGPSMAVQRYEGIVPLQ